MIQTIRRAEALSGTVLLPGDKSISHRYAMLAAIAEGTTEIRRFAASEDCHSTLRCLGGLGVDIHEDGEIVRVGGRGLHGLQTPAGTLNAGNSGTTIRLLSGILAGQSFETSITGDESLRKRPMGRIIQPMRRMGAVVESREGELPPLKIRGGRLKAVRYRLPVASAQVKSCILFAGLYGDGATAVEETVPTRDHTEIALNLFGASVRNDGGWIEVQPEPRLLAQRLEVPADLSSAAFFLVAAALVPGSDIFLPGVGLNRRRRQLLDYLRAAGLDLVVQNESERAAEPRGDLRVRHRAALLETRLQPVRGELVAALIDEIPVLAILGSQVAGGLEISDARELRIKESDRLAALAVNLRAMGADVREKPDGLTIRGGRPLHGADVDSRADHRIAMAFAVAGLAASGETRIGQAEYADISFPGFWQALAKCSRQ